MDKQAQPALLVERFSRHLEANGEVEGASDQFGQLRTDFIESNKARSREMDMEMRRIEAYFSGTRPEDEARFNQTHRELLKAMKAFQALVPGDLGATEIPRSWSDVELAVATVQAQWETRTKESYGARARQWVRKMCTGLHNHSAALDMLPKESEYVSLVAGAVGLIIKASANYTDITESFAKGVSDINDAVSIVQKSQVYDTQPVQQLVLRLYTRVFSYLHKFMVWYTSRSRSRFLRSFNENVQRTFEEDLQQVREVSIQLSQQIQLHMAADVRVSKIVAEDTNWAVKYLIELAESDRAQRKVQQDVNERLLQSMFLDQFDKSLDEMRESSRQMMAEYNERMRQSISGAAVTDLLTAQAARDMELGGPAHPLRRSPSLISDSRTQTSDTSSSDIQRQAAADIKFWSRQLDEYSNWEHVFPFTELPQQLSAHPLFVARLNSFTQTMESQIMYAFGRYQPEQPNLMRLSAAQYASLARQHGIPTVSYFCRLSAGAPPPNRTRESVELSSLLCSLIRQLVDLLPATFTASSPDHDFSEEAFNGLDGTLRTWSQAIHLLSSLVAHLRLPQLLFVVDGLNLLDDDFDDNITSAKVQELVRSLVGFVVNPHPTHPDMIIKVLFTTAGSSSALCRELDSEQVVACGGPSSPHQPGRPRATSRQLFC